MDFLFWNGGAKPALELLAELVNAHEAGVLALAECEIPDDEIVKALRESTSRSFRSPRSEVGKVRVFSDRPEPEFDEVYCNRTGRATIRGFKLHGLEFLLAVAHLVDMRNWSSLDQAYEAAILSDEIRQTESARGHARTILAGDLNMNPFDPGMVSANGLHAMMTAEIVRKKSRTVQGHEYPFFYNPMWGFFGDRTPGPPGTFHYRKSAHISYDWNILDQVLFRPDVLPWFDGTLEIVTRIGDTRLSGSDGRPSRTLGLDHFPLHFALRNE